MPQAMLRSLTRPAGPAVPLLFLFGLALTPGASPAQEPGDPQPSPRSQSPTDEFSASVEVRLAELYVSVTDRQGRPVPGLEAEDFTVRENGTPQQVDSVLDAGELPLTLGLAVDTSASMFVKLPAVAEAAQGLLDTLKSGRDRAFLVSFGPEPRLVQESTDGLWKVGSALSRLEPDGGTPLWRSVVLALEELAGIRGKRALVVLLDGADDDGAPAFRQALDAARESDGVPIYFIVMNNEAARTDGKDFRTRSFTSQLERLAETTGGTVRYVPTDSDLTAIYAEIERDLRSYYLVTYYPNTPKSAGGWREVDVQVAGKGFSVRTVPGYDPGG